MESKATEFILSEAHLAEAMMKEHEQVKQILQEEMLKAQATRPEITEKAKKYASYMKA